MSAAIDPITETKVSQLASQVADEARRRFGDGISVYWFGSWINGNANQRSDLDIAIDLPNGILPSAFIDFIDWIESLPTLYQFDIINMSEISDDFKKKIISTGRLI